MSDALHKRQRALEEEFFAKKNQQLRDKLKATFDQEVTRESLKAATGITDPAVLERLIALQLRGETMAAFWLYPLVEVAWADGKLDGKERDAILEAAVAGGIERGSPGFEMLESAMADGPTEARRKVWFAYAKDLAERLDPSERRRVRDDLVGRIRRVAEASGGLLGVGKVSSAEQRILDAVVGCFPD
jgi:tellurite resistance protein